MLLRPGASFTCCALLLRSHTHVTHALNRTSRGLHFWEVVPLEVLLGQLASEGQGGGRAVLSGGNNTAQKLHQLLVPSYFPGPEEGVVRGVQ